MQLFVIKYLLHLYNISYDELIKNNFKFNHNNEEFIIIFKNIQSLFNSINGYCILNNIIYIDNDCFVKKIMNCNLIYTDENINYINKFIEKIHSIESIYNYTFIDLIKCKIKNIKKDKQHITIDKHIYSYIDYYEELLINKKNDFVISLNDLSTSNLIINDNKLYINNLENITINHWLYDYTSLFFNIKKNIDNNKILSIINKISIIHNMEQSTIIEYINMLSKYIHILHYLTNLETDDTAVFETHTLL